MSDIVERLRESATGRPDEWRSGPCMLLREAADEIERLRAIIVALRTDCDCEPAHEAARRALEGK